MLSGATGGYCGDGTTQADLSEECDKAAHANCNAICQCEDEGRQYGVTGNSSVPCRFCGDGLVTDGEVCDNLNDPKCASDCGSCANSYTATNGVCNYCGDGTANDGEQCDLGTSSNGVTASCLGDCTYNVCGDGYVEQGGEACDDGDTSGGDGCSGSCVIESGWYCSGAPSTCATQCGDGIVAGNEACDDGDRTSGDGCSASCTIESGWYCTGSPQSTCVTQCGDGILAGAEICDDGDTTNGNGCSASCTVESGWYCSGSPLSTCATQCGDNIVAGAEACDLHMDVTPPAAIRATRVLGSNTSAPVSAPFTAASSTPTVAAATIP